MYIEALAIPVTINTITKTRNKTWLILNNSFTATTSLKNKFHSGNVVLQIQNKLQEVSW